MANFAYGTRIFDSQEYQWLGFRNASQFALMRIALNVTPGNNFNFTQGEKLTMFR